MAVAVRDCAGEVAESSLPQKTVGIASRPVASGQVLLSFTSLFAEATARVRVVPPLMFTDQFGLTFLV